MAARESLREVENLRFRFQMNNRLRLECLAAVSKVFREFDEAISDELLSTFVFALPQELANDHIGRFVSVEQSSALAAQQSGKPGLPPNKPEKPEKPDKPDKPEKPDKPRGRPEPPPPESPASLPPESPAGLPPQSEFASEYLT